VVAKLDEKLPSDESSSHDEGEQEEFWKRLSLSYTLPTNKSYVKIGMIHKNFPSVSLCWDQ